MRKPLLLAFLATLLSTHVAQAGSKSSLNLKAGVSSKDGKAKESPETEPTSDGVVPSDVPRDPRGIKGISPVWEAIAAGDAAIGAKDVDKAVKHYEAAVKADSHSAIAHYRLAEARKVKGQLTEARTSYESAVKEGEREADVRAKALFALAALAERENRLADARDAWKRYQAHAEKRAEIKSFPASASERLRRLDTQEQLSKDCAAIKDRIKKGESAPAKK